MFITVSIYDSDQFNIELFVCQPGALRFPLFWVSNNTFGRLNPPWCGNVGLIFLLSKLPKAENWAVDPSQCFSLFFLVFRGIFPGKHHKRNYFVNDFCELWAASLCRCKSVKTLTDTVRVERLAERAPLGTAWWPPPVHCPLIRWCPFDPGCADDFQPHLDRST